MLKRGSAVGLTGHEGAVDGGEREARELVSDRALRIVAERDRDLRPQQLKRVLSYAAHDSLYLSLTRGGGLRGEDRSAAGQPSGSASCDRSSCSPAVRGRIPGPATAQPPDGCIMP